MDIIQYTQEHRIFRDAVKKFLTREVIPHIEEWEEAGIVPRDVWKKMGAQGYLGMSVPEDYGGPAADFLYEVIVIEELARTNFTGLAARLHNTVVLPYLIEYGSEEQKHRYLPGCISGDIITAIGMTEPNTGSDLAAIRTTAVEDGDEFVINGQKTFISNGINCDLIVLVARDPAVVDPHRALDLFLVEAGTPGFEKGRNLKKIGWHSQDTAELFFSDCRIPRSNRLGEKGTGFRKMMEMLQQERLVVAIGAQVIAEFLLENTIAYCRERTVFGRPISRFQNSQFEFAEMATEIELGRTFIDKMIVEHMEGRDLTREVSMAKYWITDMAGRVADRCLQLHGGYGYCEEYPIARAWRDVRIMRIYAGSNEIMKVIIARTLGL
ncbi:MAG: Acyl-CoA dehydrogenase [Syntrophus sp. PtaU1.Bin005]|uniref:acyl-CoA dehydrogenase family protein n=1 Tax=Syntrophus TaxID=43773 RepID=UPI0009D0A04D|nr:MAG: Acyl-CoA dehydrogenase [Syntrophus sp. PtaB.Bin138]OPY80270.1 MAG: Acyl-CoA dehydrogenase [Syntrophus sp. PtaU1.Bin005]